MEDTKAAPTLAELREAVAASHERTLAEIDKLVAEREAINAKIRDLRITEANERRARKALDKDYS